MSGEARALADAVAVRAEDTQAGARGVAAPRSQSLCTPSQAQAPPLRLTRAPRRKHGRHRSLLQHAGGRGVSSAGHVGRCAGLLRARPLAARARVDAGQRAQCVGDRVAAALLLLVRLAAAAGLGFEVQAAGCRREGGRVAAREGRLRTCLSTDGFGDAAGPPAQDGAKPLDPHTAKPRPRRRWRQRTRSMRQHAGSQRDVRLCGAAGLCASQVQQLLGAGQQQRGRRLLHAPAQAWGRGQGGGLACQLRATPILSPACRLHPVAAGWPAAAGPLAVPARAHLRQAAAQRQSSGEGGVVACRPERSIMRNRCSTCTLVRRASR